MIHGDEADSLDVAAPGLQDQICTARLLFDAELSAGALAPAALRTRAVRRATRVRAVPPRALRVERQVRYKLGKLDFDAGVMAPLMAARRAALGPDGAPAPPRFLVRVDEFPHFHAWDDPARYGSERYERFHEVMSAAGLTYLVAVLPRVSREPLSPAGEQSRALDDSELAMLRRIAGERVSFGLHGLDHRTRFRSPRRHSELCGLGAGETEALLDRALTELEPHGIRPRVFVPPYNRFDAAQFDALARRFEVVCGGPESIGTMGFHSTPQWRGETVYLPSYLPVYGRAGEVLPAARRAIELAAGIWVPIVLHWGWEMEDDWEQLRRLAELIAPYAATWEDFRQAIGRSREGTRSSRTADAEPPERPLAR
ncbi:MAG TPA: DUF2334 domain-containing protein [Solirubrobacteraceae bacterium]|nr:DUF2334 domain-containing protein [Solirubrobacteraceae bacterium]